MTREEIVAMFGEVQEAWQGDNGLIYHQPIWGTRPVYIIPRDEAETPRPNYYWPEGP